MYTALANSIQNFTEVNQKLKKNIEENLSKFKEIKKDWLEDIITAKNDLRNEISFYLEKSVEKPKEYIFEKKENKEDYSKENKKNEQIEKLKKQIEELKENIKEQTNTITYNNNYINDISKELKQKNEEIENLKERLNNLEEKGTKI